MRQCVSLIKKHMEALKIFLWRYESVIACHISKAVLIEDLSLQLEQKVFQIVISSLVQSTVHTVTAFRRDSDTTGHSRQRVCLNTEFISHCISRMCLCLHFST
jgi:hypothetical protein